MEFEDPAGVRSEREWAGLHVGMLTNSNNRSQMVAEKSGKPRFGAKSEFVRSLDRSLSAAEVVALGEKKGLKLTPAFVYNIRSADSRSDSPSRPHRGQSRRAGRSVALDAVLTGSPEAQLRSAIAQIGLARARQILEEVEDTFAGR